MSEHREGSGEPRPETISHAVQRTKDLAGTPEHRGDDSDGTIHTFGSEAVYRHRDKRVHVRSYQTPSDTRDSESTITLQDHFPTFGADKSRAYPYRQLHINSAADTHTLSYHESEEIIAQRYTSQDQLVRKPFRDHPGMFDVGDTVSQERLQEFTGVLDEIRPDQVMDRYGRTRDDRETTSAKVEELHEQLRRVKLTAVRNYIAVPKIQTVENKIIHFDLYTPDTEGDNPPRRIDTPLDPDRRLRSQWSAMRKLRNTPIVSSEIGISPEKIEMVGASRLVWQKDFSTDSGHGSEVGPQFTTTEKSTMITPDERTYPATPPHLIRADMESFLDETVFDPSHVRDVAASPSSYEYLMENLRNVRPSMLHPIYPRNP